MLVSTPNQLISLRMILGLSQVQLGQLLDMGGENIRNMEYGRRPIKKIQQLALYGLLLEFSERHPNYKFCYDTLNHDSYVEYLLGLTKSGDLPDSRHPTCDDCSSINIRTFKKNVVYKAYGFTCLECGLVHSHKTSHTLKRMHHLRSNKSINLYSDKWYTKNCN